MASRSADFIIAEYSELGKTIRETWKYVSDILRMWVLLQFTSIVVVLINYQLFDNGHALNVSIVASWFAIIIFSTISIVLSSGAAFQNSRLYGSAMAFVDRAAHLEGVGEDDSAMQIDGNEKPQPPLPQFYFMTQELYRYGRVDLHSKLTWMYSISVLLWLAYIMYFITTTFSLFLVEFQK